VLFELPVPLPPEMLAVSCDPAAVLPRFALPVPSPPPVAVPAALPFVPDMPAPEPSVSEPVPIELVADEPPAPSVALSVPPALPPLETPAPLPAEPPLSAELDAAPLDELSPEFWFVGEPAELGAAAACVSRFPPCTNVPA
jgi:hypothetical protein